jgi:hypothetical protein
VPGGAGRDRITQPRLVVDSTVPEEPATAPPSSAEDPGVTLELSAAQIEKVMRASAPRPTLADALIGLRDVREVLELSTEQMANARLSRSLIAGLLTLASFPRDGSYVGNGELAEMLEMNQSTAHRYISTLVALGLVERDPDSRRYRLAL